MGENYHINHAQPKIWHLPKKCLAGWSFMQIKLAQLIDRMPKKYHKRLLWWVLEMAPITIQQPLPTKYLFSYFHRRERVIFTGKINCYYDYFVGKWPDLMWFAHLISELRPKSSSFILDAIENKFSTKAFVGFLNSWTMKSQIPLRKCKVCGGNWTYRNWKVNN